MFNEHWSSPHLGKDSTIIYQPHFCQEVHMELSTDGETKEFAPVHLELMDNNHDEEWLPCQTYSNVTLDVVSAIFFIDKTIRTGTVATTQSLIEEWNREILKITNITTKMNKETMNEWSKRENKLFFAYWYTGVAREHHAPPRLSSY